MPLDPKAREFLDALAAAGGPTIEQLPPPDARLALAGMFGAYADRADVAKVEDRRIAGPAGDIPLRVYTPAAAAPLPLLLYLHGGGWVLGDLESHDGTCRAFARAVPTVVVAVDYRLAPEHPFPAGVEDAYAALRWTAEHARELGGDPARIAVGGDSAGGNLSAVLCLVARDRGGPRLAFQLLVYPVTDTSLDTPSHHENGEGYLLTREAMRWFVGHYLPRAADRENPYAAPLRARDLSGLPPALVVTAEYDPLRDEGEAYANRLRAAGIPVTLHRYPGMIHGFLSLMNAFPQAHELVVEAATELRRATA